MTEIPEHLLKRSRDRRSALGLGGDAGGSDAGAASDAPAAPAAATPAVASAPAAPAAPAGRKAAAAPAAAPPPKPDSPVVAAAKRRHKIPFWAMAALSLMPIWVFMYVRSLTAPPAVAEGPMGIGTEEYGNCSSCHGGGGEGGAGRQLSEGETDKTFPHIEDQIRFVYFGTEQYNLAGVANYGDPNREGGPHLTGSFGVMPGWGALAGGNLTDAELLAVVCHERFGMAGAPDITSPDWAEEYEHWCSAESPIYAALVGGTSFADLAAAGITDASGTPIEIMDIGTAPREGSS